MMPGRVLNINLSKINVDLQRNFNFLNARLLLFRQLLSLKSILTFKSTTHTQMNIQALICSRWETFT